MTVANRTSLYADHDIRQVVVLQLVISAEVALGSPGSPGGSPTSFGVGRSQIVISPASETLLLSHTLSPGATGTVTFFWITGDPWGNGPKCAADYAIWRFYVDGETNASIVLQTSQAAFVGNADPSAPWNNDFFGKNSKFAGWHFNLPIPFSASVRVTLQLPAWWAGTERIFAMCRGVENLPVQIGAFTLPTSARLVASVVNATLAPLAFHNLLVVPAGSSGLLLGTMIDIVMYGPGASSINSLEGCWHFYSPPSTPFPGSFLLGTGAEDYPESAFYFNAGPFRGPTSGNTVFTVGQDESLISFYKLHHRDPIFFSDGCLLQWRNGDITDPVSGEKCTTLQGAPIGTPSYANVSTLVYAYVW